jgi:hypothetical protein
MGFLPAGLRPAWSGSSFLLYVGGLTVLVSVGVLLAALEDLHGSWALVGWCFLVFAIGAVAAGRAREAGRRVLAGLVALVLVAVVGVAVGAFLDAVGLEAGGFDEDLELAPLAVAAAVLAAALYAAREFRFPLLLVPAIGAKIAIGFELVGGIFGTGAWLAWTALLLGFVELGFAAAVDGDGRREWGMWKHLAAALLIGGAVVYLLDGWDVGWVLIGLVALLYVALARAFDRVAWAAVGAFGLFLVVTHFVDESAAIFEAVPLPFGAEDEGLELWQTALVYVGLGAVYAALGGWLRQPTVHETP